MNQELIDRLAAQASIQFNKRRALDDTDPLGYMESDADFGLNNLNAVVALIEQGGLEKFAELIVRECANRAAKMRHVYPHQAELTATTILDHFGVKP